MTHFCVDASTVLKWLLDEDDSRLARKLWDSGHDFIAPDLLPIELTSGIWKAHRSGKIGVDTAAAYVAATQTLPVTLFDSRELLEAAFALAVECDRSIYDCLYVGLALRESCQLVTADGRLHNALAGSHPGTLVRLADLIGPDDDP